MKNRMDEHGNKVRVYELGDGMRRRYRAALDEKRFTFPRKSQVNHPMEWYLDGHLVDRPIFGLYAMANLAEYLLHHARFGKRNQSRAIVEATQFFAATRRALQNALDNHSIDERMRGRPLSALRSRVAELVTLARIAHEAVSKHSVDCTCTACNGKSISKKDAELLLAILVEQSENGTIPKTSALYRVAT